MLLHAFRKKSGKTSQVEMASWMNTSRAVINRLLDAEDTRVTLATLAKASLAVGAPLQIEFGAS